MNPAQKPIGSFATELFNTANAALKERFAAQQNEQAQKTFSAAIHSLPDPPSPFEADAREHLEWLFRNCDVSLKRTGEILHNVADLEAELTRERQRAADEFRAERERYYHHD